MNAQPPRVVELWRLHRWALALGIAWIAIVIVFELMKPAEYSGPGLCVFRNVTSHPCPTCGGTRAVFAAARGDLAAAFMLNPLVMLAGVGAAAWLIVRGVVARSMRWTWSRAAQMWVTIGVVVALAGNWAWVIWHDV